ncbi:MAG: flagellar filament capping protein FliD [Eubacteriales bacterium]
MASSINFLGSYSGIDQTSIDSLMEAEKLPLVQMANKKSDLTEKKNAWKDINTRLNSLFEKIKTLHDKDTYSAKTAVSTNENVVTMSPSKNTAAGSYKIHVAQLATNTTIISGTIAGATDTTTALGLTGDFNITNAEGEGLDVEVAATDTLRNIMDKINAGTKETGISATIIDNRLVISDQTTGVRDIQLTGDGILADLGLDATIEDTVTVTQGKNALFTINGIDVERTSNSISDVVLYTTIHLSKEHGVGEYDTVNVSLDTSKVTTAMQDFVDQYNSTMTFISELLFAGDSESELEAGKLAGDSALMRLQSTLRSYVTGTITNGNTDIQDISQLGIGTFDKEGQLKFDASKATAALQKDPQNVMNFFISKDSKGNDIGFGPKLQSYVDSFISSSSGVIKGKTESYESTLKDLTKRIDAFNLRMERKEAYYIKMFTALDVALAQAESQTSWLTSQIAAMNGTSKDS